MKVIKQASRPKQWTDAEQQQLMKLVRRGSDALEISLVLGRHTASVRRMAREMKLMLRKKTIHKNAL